MAMKASTWTVTMNSTGAALGATIDPETGTITRISDGVLSQLNDQIHANQRTDAEEPFSPGSQMFGAIELGDRIIAVDGVVATPEETAHDLVNARLQDGKLGTDGPFGRDLSLTLLRPMMVQPMVVQMQPSEQLGVDVDVMQTNRIQTIDDGLIAELNKVYPGSVEIGDRILEVDGKAGAAVDNIRDWVAARDPAAGPANLHLAVARQATYANGVLGDGLELEGAAWSFSVMVRVQPGQSLGASIDVDTNLVTAIGESGAIPNVNQSHPRAIQVGDRIVSVDGVRCPSMKSIAELESWFQGRKLYSKGIPRDLRIALLRPVELAADFTVLPPYEYCLALPPPAALPSAEAGGKEARAPEDEQSGASTVSTTSPRLPDASSGERRPSQLTTPVPLSKFADSKAVAAPPRRWYQIFQGSCCQAEDDVLSEERILKVVTDANAVEATAASA
jgi:hypothetical protein